MKALVYYGPASADRDTMKDPAILGPDDSIDMVDAHLSSAPNASALDTTIGGSREDATRARKESWRPGSYR